MILPPGETDKHLFDLEAACKALEAQMTERFTITTDTVYLDEKYEKRREMLIKIFRAVDKNMDRYHCWILMVFDLHQNSES